MNKIIEKKSDDFLLNSIVKNKYTTTIKEIETVVENITPKLFEGCKLLLNKIISGTPIIIRFHNEIFCVIADTHALFSLALSIYEQYVVSLYALAIT